MLSLVGPIAGRWPAAAATARAATDRGTGDTVEMVGRVLHADDPARRRPATTVTFVNRDPIAHNVTANGWGHFDDLDEGDRFTTSFDDDGRLPVRLHATTPA